MLRLSVSLSIFIAFIITSNPSFQSSHLDPRFAVSECSIPGPIRTFDPSSPVVRICCIHNSLLRFNQPFQSMFIQFGTDTASRFGCSYSLCFSSLCALHVHITHGIRAGINGGQTVDKRWTNDGQPMDKRRES